MLSTMLFAGMVLAKCYTVENYGTQKYRELKIAPDYKASLVLQNGTVIKTEAPALDEITLRGSCHGTQGGDWVCTPDVTVHLYKYDNEAIESVWFQKDLKHGVLQLVHREAPLRLWEKACE